MLKMTKVYGIENPPSITVVCIVSLSAAFEGQYQYLKQALAKS
jgi:hypothetical protein